MKYECLIASILQFNSFNQKYWRTHMSYEIFSNSYRQIMDAFLFQIHAPLGITIINPASAALYHFLGHGSPLFPCKVFKPRDASKVVWQAQVTTQISTGLHAPIRWYRTASQQTRGSLREFDVHPKTLQHWVKKCRSELTGKILTHF